MRIATWNVNSVNARLETALRWLEEVRPDVVCLQELKATDGEFPASAIQRAGYRAVWQGERSWNGVAILTRECNPVLTRSTLPGNPLDSQARYIEAAVNGVLIASLYLPNGNPQPGPKFDYKLAWFQRLIDHSAELMKACKRRSKNIPVSGAGARPLGGGKGNHPEGNHNDVVSQKGVPSGTICSRTARRVCRRNQ